MRAEVPVYASFAQRLLLATLSLTTAGLWLSVFCLSAGFAGLCAGVLTSR